MKHKEVTLQLSKISNSLLDIALAMEREGIEKDTESYKLTKDFFEHCMKKYREQSQIKIKL